MRAFKKKKDSPLDDYYNTNYGNSNFFLRKNNIKTHFILKERVKRK